MTLLQRLTRWMSDGSRPARPAKRRPAAKPAVERLGERLVPAAPVEVTPPAVFSVHGDGTWMKQLYGSWTKLTSHKPTIMDEGRDGTLYGVYADGTWRYRAGGWQKLTPARATALDAADDDTLVASFAGQGTWEWDGNWGQITPHFATDVAAVRNNHAYLEFAGSGLYE